MADPSKYKILQKISEGSFGEVHLAQREDELYAMKIVREFVRDLGSVQQDYHRNLLRNEARVLKYLKQGMCLHNILSYVDFVESSGRMVLITKYFRGEDLFDARHKIKMNEWPLIFRQIAEAVRDIHSLGIIHRDIKPENILYTRDESPGKTLLIDFGFACTVHSSVVDNYGIELHNPHDSRGSLFYAPPEIILRNNTDPYRADIYSLGMTFYALISDCFPYPSDRDREYLSHIINPRIKPAGLPNNIPSELRRLIMLMIDKDSRFRPTINYIITHLGKMSY